MQLSSDTDLGNWPVGGIPQSRYALRPFATKTCDLDIDFDQTAQPYLVTQILALCLSIEGEPITQAEVWCWSLKKRLQGLLQIAIATRGNELVLRVNCLNQQCRDRFELPLELSRFEQEIDEQTFDVEFAGQRLKARLPNGQDQRFWLQHQNESMADIAQRLLLFVDNEPLDKSWHFPPDWLDEFGQKLEARDELMSLRFTSNCPQCEQALETIVDLEAQLLTYLSFEQKNLQLDIHRLALTYHWTESEILALSSKRRGFYLKQLNNLTHSGAV